MRRFIIALVLIAAFADAKPSSAIPVDPVIDTLGSFAPTITNFSDDEVWRPCLTSDPADCIASGLWFVTFDLFLIPANVRIGVQELPPLFNSPAAVLGQIFLFRVVAGDAQLIATGTDTFANPFPSPVDLLIEAGPLAAGDYAIGISGSANRYQQFSDMAGTRQDRPDFAVRLQVLVPEPSAGLLAFSALAGLFGLARLPGWRDCGEPRGDSATAG